MFLKSHNNEYLSGQDLSEVLKISRVAVWKHISKIKELGYKIESKQKLGYRLIEESHLPLPWEVTEGLTTKKIGRRVYYFDEIDSTQNFAMKISSENTEDGTVIIAKRQTAGKGRLGRSWISPKGGLWFSIILKPSFDISHASLVPILVSVAIGKTIEELSDLKPSLKWPNDVTIDGKKVAGIIIDTSVESNTIGAMAIGIGVNVKIDSKKIEKKIKGTSNFYGVTSLEDFKVKIEPKIFLRVFLQKSEDLLALLEQGDSQKITKDWIKRSSTIGKTVSIHNSDKVIEGKAVDLDKDGSLLIKKDQKIVKVFAGDVNY